MFAVGQFLVTNTWTGQVYTGGLMVKDVIAGLIQSKKPAMLSLK